MIKMKRGLKINEIPNSCQISLCFISYKSLIKTHQNIEMPYKSRRSLILIMMRVILGTYKVVLIGLVFGRSAQVRSFNCDMYWLCLYEKKIYIYIY